MIGRTATIAGGVAADPDNPFAPVTFKAAGGNRFLVMLGARNVGEIMPDAAGLGLVVYTLRLPDVPSMWRKPVALDVARERIVDTVREWIDTAGIGEWLRSIEATRVIGYQGRK